MRADINFDRSNLLGRWTEVETIEIDEISIDGLRRIGIPEAKVR